MTIQEIHDFIKFLKNQGQGGYHSPDQIDSALNAAQTDKYNEEKRQFEATSVISSNLNPFQVFDTINLTSGFGDLPEDFDLETNAATTGNLQMDILRESEWLSRINDPIAAPTAEKPVCILRNQIEVRPTSLTAMKLFYLRKPADMVYGFTLDGEDYIYDSGTSTQCEWPDSCHVDIILRACVYLGIPLNDEMLMRLKAYKKQTENV